jgi:hypothetical protein
MEISEELDVPVSYVLDVLRSYSIQSVRLDDSGRLLKIEYLPQKVALERAAEVEKNPFGDSADEYTDIYDDPDLWPDGKRPKWNNE